MRLLGKILIWGMVLVVMIYLAGLAAEALGTSNVAAFIGDLDHILEQSRYVLLALRLILLSVLLYFAEDILRWYLNIPAAIGPEIEVRRDETKVITAKFRRSVFIVAIWFEALYWLTHL